MDHIRLQSVSELLYTEARCLDDRNWDGWLDLYLPDAQFWIPMWDAEHELTEDPQTQLSLMYYPDRSGLEDRVFRLRTGASSASHPLPRTLHQITNITAQEAARGRVRVESNCQTMSYRHKAADVFYCRYEHLVEHTDRGWRIAGKKIVVLNDLIRDVLDFYRV